MHFIFKKLNINKMINVIRMEEEYEQEIEFDEEWEEDLEEDETSEIKPELKRLYQQHPECKLDYVEQVINHLSNSNPVEKKTCPFITNFEKTKIIGLRANQISKGAAPFITVPAHVTDVRQIARLELEQKRLPFIIKRPLPDGTFEYWRLVDLMILG
jgi:DNA-directed RNA polymerase subunit K/omega